MTPFIQDRFQALRPVNTKTAAPSSWLRRSFVIGLAIDTVVKGVPVRAVAMPPSVLPRVPQPPRARERLRVAVIASLRIIFGLPLYVSHFILELPFGFRLFVRYPAGLGQGLLPEREARLGEPEPPARQAGLLKPQ